MNAMSKLVLALRWLAFLPGAFLAALLGSALINVLTRGSMYLSGVNPDSLFTTIASTFLGNFMAGMAFVYFGARITPSHRKQVAYILTVFAVLIAGSMSFPAIVQSDWWALAGAISLAGGGASIAYGIAQGELNIESHRLT